MSIILPGQQKFCFKLSLSHVCIHLEKPWFLLLPVKVIIIYRSINLEICNITEVQRKTQYFGDLGDESMARSETAGDWGLGWGKHARDRFPALRGTGRRCDDERSWSLQVRDVGETRSWGWLRLGLLRIQVAHTLLRQVWLVVASHRLEHIIPTK